MVGTGIRIDCYPGEDRPVAIRTRRAVHAARLFEGKSPDEVAALMPVVFAVCGNAQGAAAHHALASASGAAMDAVLTAAQGVLVRLEIAREHLWRVLMDWPRFTQSDVPASALARMQSLLPAARDALFDGAPFAPEPAVSIDRAAMNDVLVELDDLLEASVLGIAPASWLRLATLDDLERSRAASLALLPAMLSRLAEAGWERAGTTESTFLPALPFDELELEFRASTADRFVEIPDWAGRACETSPLSRQHGSDLVKAALRAFGNGVLARVIAVASELATTSRDISDMLEGSADPGIRSAGVAPGTGIAQVEAARGRLLHRAAVRDGVVKSYRVVAPTEWNFHPEGVVSAALRDLSAGAEKQADLFVTLMDPCVAHSIEIH